MFSQSAFPFSYADHAKHVFSLGRVQARGIMTMVKVKRNALRWSQDAQGLILGLKGLSRVPAQVADVAGRFDRDPICI